MAKQIPIPTRGQPVDAEFLSKIAQSVNELSTAVDQRKGKSFVKATPESKGSSKSTANTSFFASTFQVNIPSENVDETTKGEATVTFSEVAFDGPPVVTATAVVFGDTSEGAKNAIVTISDITKAGCKVNVRFSTKGLVKTLYVHVIAIGMTP